MNLTNTSSYQHARVALLQLERLTQLENHTHDTGERVEADVEDLSLLKTVVFD